MRPQVKDQRKAHTSVSVPAAQRGGCKVSCQKVWLPSLMKSPSRRAPQTRVSNEQTDGTMLQLLQCELARRIITAPQLPAFCPHTPPHRSSFHLIALPAALIPSKPSSSPVVNLGNLGKHNYGYFPPRIKTHHWFPLHLRTKLKASSITFRNLQDLAPACFGGLISLIEPHSSQRELTSP